MKVGQGRNREIYRTAPAHGRNTLDLKLRHDYHHPISHKPDV